MKTTLIATDSLNGLYMSCTIFHNFGRVINAEARSSKTKYMSVRCGHSQGQRHWSQGQGEHPWFTFILFCEIKTDIVTN